MYVFSNILGIFVFDDRFNIIDKVLFGPFDDYKNKSKFLEGISNKHKGVKSPEGDSLRQILLYFKNGKFHHDFHSKNIELTRFGLKNSVQAEAFISQAINSIDEIDKSINILMKRLREWYELHNPEFSRATRNNEEFVEEIAEKGKTELLDKIKISLDESFGSDLGQENLEPIKSLARQISDLYRLRKNLAEYASITMDGFCPNLKAVCDTIVGARLIDHAGSLKRLSQMPSSTIQILGAEQALFRHLKTGSKPPRHGIIIGHELIAKARNSMHGKIARALADKISIAAKIDYFNGKFIGDKLRKELDKKFGKN